MTTDTPLPRGFGVRLAADTKELSDGSLFGGSPARVLRLTPAGRDALAELRCGPIQSAAAAVLARRLTDAGLAYPVPPAAAAGRSPDVTIVIPVRDRAAMLARCLAASGHRYTVVVVDDGSADAQAIAAVAAEHGADVVRRDCNGGPAAARNTGLTGARTELIAFLDSDCTPPPDWIEQLAPHFADPLVAAVAPRVVALSPRTAAGRYEQARGSLDVGDHAGRVVPGGRVGYVPTAALLVRRAALETLAGDTVFDQALRYGEDVDLVWRLHEAGWRIRYEPAVQVPHESPRTWRRLLARRFRYGTSAAPLARRHPANLAPLVLQPWPAAAVLAGLAARPLAATAATAGAWLHIAGSVRRAGVPADGAPGAALTAVRQTWLGVGRYAVQFAAPALAAALVAPGPKAAGQRWPGLRRTTGLRAHACRRSAARRAAAASLLLGPAISAYVQRRPQLDPVRYMLAHLADDICYGAGVWVGCLRERTLLPVTPAISWRPVRMAPRRDGKV